MDWTFGSKGMQERESQYLKSTNDDVYFAVGSYGTDASLAGFCYRMTVNGMKKDIIMQVNSKY